ncbi:hypothetical protein RKD49_004692 [Streptomyces glaucescens]
MRDGKERSVAAVCCWAVVLVGLLPGLVLLTPHVRFGAAVAVQCVVVVHTGAALARVLTATSVRLVAFGFWLFTYVWLGLAPLAMLATDTYPLDYRTSDSTALAAVVLTELGLVAYSAGSALAARAAGDGSTALGALLSRRLAPWPVLLLSGLSLVLAVVLIPRQGGLDAFFTSRQAVREAGVATDSVRALLAWALAVPAFWSLLALLHLPRPSGGDRLLRGVRWMLLPLLIAVNVVVNNPISKPRFWAGTVVLVLLFSWRRFRRPKAFRAAAAAITVVILFAFPYSDYFRYDEREELSVMSLAEQLSTTMDYDAFQQMQTGIDYVEDDGFSPSSALGVALFMVPRAVWPDKPQATGVAIAQYAGYDFHNLSAPLWIESYLWAGVPAVAVVFCLMGALGRRMDDLWELLRDRRAAFAVLLVPAFAFYQMILLRGSLMGIAGPMLLLLTVPLFITVPAARRSRAPSSALPPATAGHAPTPGTGGIRVQP